MSSESTKAPEPADPKASAAPAPDPAPDPKPDPAPSPTAPASPAAKRHSPPWPEWLRDVAVSLCRWLSRPRVRLTLTGLILLLVGGLVVTGSVWTLPLVIAGAVMVVIAWVGHRLDGRLAVEWGETGAQLEFRAKMRAPAHPLPLPVLAEPAATPRSLARGVEAEPEPEDAEVIEGEAHTVEIEVAELKALIAAAEAAETTETAEPTHAEASEHAARILRVAHGGGRSSDTAG
jgi:hypothetical protein